MNYGEYIVFDPAVCGGEPVIRGTRVTVRTVLASPAEGMSVEEIAKDVPTLDETAVGAVIAFAAASVDIAEDCPNVGVPRPTGIAIDPTNPRSVWVGLEVDGVRHSTDGGDSWRKLWREFGEVSSILWVAR